MSTPQYPGYGQDPYAQQPQGPSAPWPEHAAQPYGQQPYPGAVPPAPPQPPAAAPQPYPYGQTPAYPYGQAPQGHPQEHAAAYAPHAYTAPDAAAAGHYGQPYQPYGAQPPAPLPPVPGAPAAQGKRVVAYLIDTAVAAGISLVFLIIALVLMLTVDIMAGNIVLIVLFVALLAWAFVYSWMQGTNGSLGARAQRIRIASLETGEPIGFGKALLRNLVLGATSAPLGLGLFSILFDKTGRNQGWHDKAVGAIVLEGRPAAGPAQHEAASQAAPAKTGAPAWPAPTVDPYATILPEESTLASPSAPADPYAPAANPYAPAPASDPYAPAPAADPYAPAPAANPYAPAPAANPYAAAPPADPYPAAPPADPYPAAPVAPPAPSYLPAPPVPPAPAPAPAAAETAPVDPFATLVPPPFSGPVTASSPLSGPTPTPSPLSNDAVISFVPGITEDRPAVPPLPTDELPDDTVIVQRRPEVKRAVLVWDDEIRHVVSLRTVFGRNPAQVDGVESIAVRDDSLSLSKTHFEIDVDEHGAWVIDRNSTNGVEIVRGGQHIKVTSGERTPLQAGDALQMGDREVTIQAIA